MPIQATLDGDRRYKWIQVDTTCIRATCRPIRCKRGIRDGWAAVDNNAGNIILRSSVGHKPTVFEDRALIMQTQFIKQILGHVKPGYRGTN